MKMPIVILAAMVLATIILSVSCSDDDALGELYGTWATDLEPLGHVGYSHLILNEDLIIATDHEFIFAGSDCTLDQEHAGTYVADETTMTFTYDSGVIEVRDCTGDAEAANHGKREMTSDELATANAIGTFNWAVSGNTLTLDNGADITRIYTRQ
jgi:hypothetical protein